jgi:L-seryl-tRNA(Ser) seleniumtransferase
LASSAVAIGHNVLQPQELLQVLRQLDPAVIGRISEDRVLLDLRTVEPEFDATLVSLLQQVANKPAMNERSNPV